MKKLFILAITLCSSLFTVDAADKKDLVDYVNPLVGSQSKLSLSTGNTYPAIAMPWGMNFWMPQTGKMGDGWAYTYDADKIRGFKQTHQPSPWINDYGQFAIMPVTGKVVFNQDKRASWFSHKAEVAKPNYYRVYLADHDVVTEITPTERAAMFRFTFPESDNSYVIVDALIVVHISRSFRKKTRLSAIRLVTAEGFLRTSVTISLSCSTSLLLIRRLSATMRSAKVKPKRKKIIPVPLSVFHP